METGQRCLLLAGDIGDIFSMFYLTPAALLHLKDGSTIINTTSATAYRWHPALILYACTKGALTSLSR